ARLRLHEHGARDSALRDGARDHGALRGGELVLDAHVGLEEDLRARVEARAHDVLAGLREPSGAAQDEAAQVAAAFGHDLDDAVAAALRVEALGEAERDGGGRLGDDLGEAAGGVRELQARLAALQEERAGAVDAWLAKPEAPAAMLAKTGWPAATRV